MSLSPWLPGMFSLALLLTLRLLWRRHGFFVGLTKLALGLLLAFFLLATWNAYDMTHEPQPATTLQR